MSDAPSLTDERYDAICEAQGGLERLLRLVCPLCAEDEALFCEVVYGIHHHVSGKCKASQVRELMAHVDDVRDQFANKFNPDEKPRAIWGITSIPELVKPPRG
jgi:hypothetical protein